MIGKDQIAEALRNADAVAEERGFEDYWQGRVDTLGLSYVAMQHGLRAVLVLRGESPNLPVPTPIYLTDEEARLQRLFASSFMTGFATRDRIR